MSQVAPPGGDSIPEPRSRRGFRIAWYIYVLWILTTAAMVISMLLAPTSVQGSDSFKAGYRVGTLIGAVIIPPIFAFIPAVIVYFIARRSTLALNITLLVMFVLLLLIGLASAAGNLLRAAGA